MMTVLHRGRRARRFRRLWASQNNAPRTWGPRWALARFRVPPISWTAPGSAKPGRGGRRRRKVDRAIIRRHIGAGVERKGWPLLWELRILRLSRMPTRFTRKLALAPLLMPPAGFAARLQPATSHLGRRERRRRAKLRRRRARAERRAAARSFLFALPPFYRPVRPGALWREINRMAARLRPASPTPGA